MVYILLLLFSAYGIMLLMFTWAWRATPKRYDPAVVSKVTVSVLAPVRNEARNLETLIRDLQNQTYSSFNVLVIDDFSEDGTVDVFHQIAHSDPRFTLLHSPEPGKKAALRFGIENSASEIIVTTDADTRHHPGWLSTIAGTFVKESPDLLIGPVSVEADSFFGSMQAIEFAALIGSTAVTVRLGHPAMCNGANLAFRKKIFDDVRGYEGNMTVASGDDEFLMRKIADRGGKICFLKDDAGMVTTSAAATFSDFFRQRLRWAGKWKFNSSFLTKSLALIIFSIHLSMLVWMFMLVTHRQYELAAFVLVCRAILEATFLIPVCRFLQVRWNWLAFIALQVFHPLYVVGIGLFSNFLPNSWKGRKI